MATIPSSTSINREAHARSPNPPYPPSSPTPSIPEPKEGDLLLEELEEPWSPSSGSVQHEGTKKGKRVRVRKWKLVGDVLGRGAFSSVWGARRVVEDEGNQEDGLDEDEADVLKETRKGLVAVKMMYVLCLLSRALDE
jgi:hypothetical protein